MTGRSSDECEPPSKETWAGHERPDNHANLTAGLAIEGSRIAFLRTRRFLKSPVLENGTPGSVQGCRVTGVPTAMADTFMKRDRDAKMAKIFISYRREDSEWPAHEIYNAIRRRVHDPKEDVFIDVDHIPLGVNFKDHINGKVAQCDVLLALIGRGWLNVRDPQTGERRLDNPDDFVRIEIASALESGLKVVPVLLDGTPPPREVELPDDLKELSLRNGIEVRRLSFEADVERLLAGLRLHAASESPEASPNRHAPGAASGVLIADTSDAGFEADVVQASKSHPVIVLFWAPWCGVCMGFRPKLEKAVCDAERPLRLLELNVEENPLVPRELSILAVPSVYSYYQGHPVDGFRGVSSPHELRDFISRQVNRVF